MKIQYITHLRTGGTGSFVGMNFEGDADNIDPEALALVHGMLQQFMDYDRERAEALATERPTPPAADGSSEAE